MNKKVTVVSGLVAATVIGIAITSAIIMNTPPHSATVVSAQEAVFMSEMQARSRAIELAQWAGMTGKPTRDTAKLISLEEYLALDGVRIGPDGWNFGLDPSLQVWVFAIEGRGVSNLPGGDSGTPGRPFQPEVFEAITVAVDARTGEYRGSGMHRTIDSVPALLRN